MSSQKNSETFSPACDTTSTLVTEKSIEEESQIAMKNIRKTFGAVCEYFGRQEFFLDPCSNPSSSAVSFEPSASDDPACTPKTN